MADASNMTETIITAASGLVGAALGGYLVWITTKRLVRRKSIYDIADILSDEAAEWTRRKYNAPNPDFVEYHIVSIAHLSPHIHYVRTRHPTIGDKIWPDWVAFHGGNADREPDYNSYYDDGIPKGKDFWIVCLYRIADTLRES